MSQQTGGAETLYPQEPESWKWIRHTCLSPPPPPPSSTSGGSPCQYLSLNMNKGFVFSKKWHSLPFSHIAMQRPGNRRAFTFWIQGSFCLAAFRATRMETSLAAKWRLYKNKKKMLFLWETLKNVFLCGSNITGQTDGKPAASAATLLRVRREVHSGSGGVSTPRLLSSERMSACRRANSPSLVQGFFSLKRLHEALSLFFFSAVIRSSRATRGRGPFSCCFFQDVLHILMLYMLSPAELPSLTAQPKRKILADLDRNVDIPCLATGTLRIYIYIYICICIYVCLSVHILGGLL